MICCCQFAGTPTCVTCRNRQVFEYSPLPMPLCIQPIPTMAVPIETMRVKIPTFDIGKETGGNNGGESS
jgi:hypothetical protein